MPDNCSKPPTTLVPLRPTRICNPNVQASRSLANPLLRHIRRSSTRRTCNQSNRAELGVREHAKVALSVPFLSPLLCMPKQPTQIICGSTLLKKSSISKFLALCFLFVLLKTKRIHSFTSTQRKLTKQENRDKLEAEVEQFYTDDPGETRELFHQSIKRLKTITSADWFMVRNYDPPPPVLAALLTTVCTLMLVRDSWKSARNLVGSSVQNMEVT